MNTEYSGSTNGASSVGSADTTEHGTANGSPATSSGTDRLRPRTGPIVWGALILAFCAYVAQRTIAPGAVDTSAWLIVGVIGLGLLLLIVGVIVLVRSDRRADRASSPSHPVDR